MRNFLLSAFAALAICLPTQAQTAQQVPAEYKAELKKMIEATHALQNIDAVLPIVKQQLSQARQTVSVSAQQKEQIEKVMEQTNTFVESFISDLKKDLLDLIAPTYYNNVSITDLRALNKFYETEAGKRISAAMPKMTEETALITQQYFAPKMQELTDKLAEKGLLPQTNQ